jgi:hypothetical protein
MAAMYSEMFAVAGVAATLDSAGSGAGIWPVETATSPSGELVWIARALAFADGHGIPIMPQTGMLKRACGN